MEIVIQAKSSEGSPYDVTFLIGGEKPVVKCTCKAGIFGLFCKHRRALLLGDLSMLFDPAQEPELREALKLFSQTKSFVEIQAVNSELDELEKEKVALARREKKLKARLAEILG